MTRIAVITALVELPSVRVGTAETGQDSEDMNYCDGRLTCER